MCRRRHGPLRLDAGRDGRPDVTARFGPAVDPMNRQQGAGATHRHIQPMCEDLAGRGDEVIHAGDHDNLARPDDVVFVGHVLGATVDRSAVIAERPGTKRFGPLPGPVEFDRLADVDDKDRPTGGACTPTDPSKPFTVRREEEFRKQVRLSLSRASAAG